MRAVAGDACITASDAIPLDACAPRDIDEDVLEAAEELAERQNKTPGQVISELVRRGVLCTNTHSDQKPLRRIDRLVTNALVNNSNKRSTRKRLEKRADTRMRTTLDIDDDVLEIAKQRAKAERKTAGRVISELARQALAEPRERLDFSKVEIVDGIPILPSRGGVVTKELVDKLIEQSGE